MYKCLAGFVLTIWVVAGSRVSKTLKGRELKEVTTFDPTKKVSRGQELTASGTTGYMVYSTYTGLCNQSVNSATYFALGSCVPAQDVSKGNYIMTSAIENANVIDYTEVYYNDACGTPNGNTYTLPNLNTGCENGGDNYGEYKITTTGATPVYPQSTGVSYTTYSSLTGCGDGDVYTIAEIQFYASDLCINGENANFNVLSPTSYQSYKVTSCSPINVYTVGVETDIKLEVSIYAERDCQNDPVAYDVEYSEIPCGPYDDDFVNVQSGYIGYTCYNPSSDSNDKLSAGATAGIAIGVVLGALGLFMLLVYVFRGNNDICGGYFAKKPMAQNHDSVNEA